MKIERVGIAGCGLMGSGIAQACAVAGLETHVLEVSAGVLQKGLGRIEHSLSRLVLKGKIPAEESERVRQRLQGTLRWNDLVECDLLIEAANEDFEIKKQVLQSAEDACRSDVIIASNTSSLSINRLMAVMTHPERFLGLHFFNPVPVMKLVEIVTSLATSPQVTDRVVRFTEALGKTPVRCQDRTGFLVNRLLIPYLLDAVRALETGTGSMEDIDLSMKLGCGYPMGPFELMDFIGLDTILHISDIMYEEFRESRMAAPPLLKRLVYAGHLGRKSGQGFHDYKG